MTTPAVHDCPFCRGVGCSHCGGGDVDDREIDKAPTEPGIYSDISEAVYHGDRNSLSSSGARALLACPARFRHERDSPVFTDHYDFGHAAHSLVLGAGMEIVEVQADSWRTKAAQSERDAARAAGKAPMLSADLEVAVAMAEAVRDHPIAAKLLAAGQAEASMYWTDPATWVRLRARPDWMTEEDGRVVQVDYKTTASAAPRAFAASAQKYGYHQQAAWYRTGALELGASDDPRFVFIAQEKTRPYLVSVHEFGREDIEIGERLNRKAIDLYAECMASDVWPGYGDHIHHMRLPYWARYDAEEFA